MTQVTVVGLGLMGATLARLLVAAGHEVTVWSQRLRLDSVPGAKVAGHLETAVAVCPVILICIRDITAVRILLDRPKVMPLLDARMVVNLSSGSPSDAQSLADWLCGRGASFLDGAIMNNPAQMGLPGSRILLAGDAGTQTAVAAILSSLAEDIRNVGPSFRAAKAMYQAFEMTFFGHLAAALHAADICLSEGIDLTHLHALHSKDPTHQGFIQTLIDGHFRTSDITLETWASDLALIRKQAVETGISSTFPDLLAVYFDRAIAAGYGQDDVMAIWNTLT
ncbi:MAG: NAD(P)-binding domain-containing protein [bacterium]